MNEITIERYEPADLDRIMEIENTSFEAPWSRKSYEEVVPLDTISFWVAKSNGRVVGYMLLQKIESEMELHTFAVAPEERRKGIAIKLLERMRDEAKRSGVSSVFLQVRPSNKEARSLYGKFGFTPIGMRRRYYQNDGEDAIVMKMETELSS